VTLVVGVIAARLGLHSLVLFVAFVGGLLAFGPAGAVFDQLAV
jgi:predicted PurR-regulated permease PerM